MEINADVLEEWVEKYSQNLLNTAYFLLSNKEDAEDIVQDVFLTVFLQIENFKEKSSPLTWLKGILKNKVADRYRAKYKTENLISFDDFFDENGIWKETDILNEWQDDENSLENLLDDNAFNDTLSNCLEKLPEKWRILVKFSYLQEKNTSDICEEIGVSTANFWKILQRSRLQLRKCIEINWFEKTNNEYAQ